MLIFLQQIIMKPNDNASDEDFKFTINDYETN